MWLKSDIDVSEAGLMFKPYLHWQRLCNNTGDNDSDSDMKQYLQWPPWAMRHREDCFYLCHYTQGGQGK